MKQNRSDYIEFIKDDKQQKKEQTGRKMKMSTLYKLTEEYMELLAIAEEEDLDPQTLQDTFEGLQGEFEEKADNYAILIKALKGQEDMLDVEIKRLQERKQILINNQKRMKESLENAMNLTGNRKFKTLLHSFNIQKNPPSLQIDNEEAVPKEFYTLKKVFDNAAIKKYLKENGQADFAHLVQGESLRIR